MNCSGCGAPLPPNKAPGRRRKWCSDKCRKRTMYSLTCVYCGGYVNGASRRREPDEEPVCRKCTPRHTAVWSREAIVLAIQEWADEHGGVPPVVTDWNPAMARNLGKPEKAERFYRDGHWPVSNTVQYYFGSWAEALRAAGFEPFGSGQYGREGEDPGRVSEIVDLYRSGLSTYQVAEKLGVGVGSVTYHVRKAGAIRSNKEAQRLRWGRAA